MNNSFSFETEVFQTNPGKGDVRIRIRVVGRIDFGCPDLVEVEAADRRYVILIQLDVVLDCLLRANVPVVVFCLHQTEYLYVCPPVMWVPILVRVNNLAPALQLAILRPAHLRA